MRTSPFTLDSKVRAEWFDTDPTAVSYDVTVTQVQDGVFPSDPSAAVVQTLTKVTRTALVLKPGTGNTVCVHVAALDAVGNVSNTSSSCITIPSSLAPPWNSGKLKRIKATHAWHHYYVVLVPNFVIWTPINMAPFRTMSKVAVAAERCKGCGKVAIGLVRSYETIKHLITISLESSSKTGKFMLFTRSLKTNPQRKFGPGYIVLYTVAGKPHVSGLGYVGASY
jgi:hypothetical protein